MSSIYSINKNNTQAANRRETLSLVYKPTTEPDRLVGLRDQVCPTLLWRACGNQLASGIREKMREARVRRRSFEIAAVCEGYKYVLELSRLF